MPKSRRRGRGEGSVYQRKDGRWEAKLSLDSGKLIQRQDDNERGQATMLAMYRMVPSPAAILMKVEPGYGAAVE